MDGVQAAMKGSVNFNIKMLYNAAHFDVIASLNPTAILPSPELYSRKEQTGIYRFILLILLISCIFTEYVYLISFR